MTNKEKRKYYQNKIREKIRKRMLRRSVVEFHGEYIKVEEDVHTICDSRRQ